MKKVKTLVTIIALMLVSFIAPACSCGGAEEEPIKHVYAQGLSLRLVTDGSAATVKEIEIPGDASGKIYIECEEEDVFTIEYSITPADTTKTKVNWAFSTEGVVKPYLNEGYTRNNTAVEKVKFQAQDIVGDNNITELTFSTTEYEKSATCIIEVKIPAAERSTLLTPENVRFDATEKVLAWNPVTKMTNIRGVNVNISGGELDAYQVTSYESQYNAEEETYEYVQVGTVTVPATQTTYAIENGYESGKLYAYSVKAIGNQSLANDSESSGIYKFYKLNPATSISNNNGTVSFTPVDYTEDISVYLDGIKINATKSTIEPNQIATLSHKGFNSNKLVYNIQLMSYPCDISEYNATTGYAIADENDAESVINYFASELTETLTLYKLKAPTSLNLAEGAEKSITIGSSTFSVTGSNYIEIIDSIGAGEADNNPANVGIKYGYQVYAGENLDVKLGESRVTTNSAISLEQLGLSNGSYKIRVWTIGNEENTIDSMASGHMSDVNKQYKDISFNILPTAKTPSMSTTVNNGDTLNLDMGSTATGYYAGGFELLFVHKTDPTKSRKFTTELSSVGIKTTTFNVKDYVEDTPDKLYAGTYDVYVKNLSCVNSSNYNAVVLGMDLTSFSSPFTVVVAGNPTGMSVSHDGVLTFKKVSNFDVYGISIRRTSGTDIRTDKVFLYPNISDNQSIGEPLYDVNGDIATITLRDIFEYLDLGDESYTYEAYFVNPYKFAIRMYTEGTYSVDTESTGDTAVSSTETKPFEFTVNTTVQSIRLINYNLTFSMATPPQGYIIRAYSVGENESLTKICEATTGATSGATSETFNLNELLTSDKKIFADCLADKTGKIMIEVVAVGKEASVSSSGILSTTATATFDITNQVNSLALDAQGNLTWKTSTLDPSGHTYNVYFATVDGSGSISSLNSETITGITSSTRTEGSGDEAVTVPVLTTNIADLLAKYEGQTIAVSVQELKTNMFSGEPSNYLFATRIPAPTGLGYQVTQSGGTDYRVVWDDVTDATFSVSVSGAKTINPISTSDNFYSITSQINNSDAPWGAGTYTITVLTNISSNSSDAGKTYQNPIALSSATSSIDVTLIDKGITLTAEDYVLSWVNPTYTYEKNSTFNIRCSYVEIGSDDSTTVKTALTEEIQLGDTIMSSITFDTFGKLSNPYNYSVEVSPSIDFASTGFIYIGEVKTNNIKKFTTPTNLHAENGALHAQINEILPEGNFVIELYEVSGETSTIVSPADYEFVSTADEENKVTSIVITLKDKVASGDHSYAIKVKANNQAFISSQTSKSYLATKLAITSDFTVENVDNVRYLTWASQPGVGLYKIYYYHGTSTDNINEIILSVEYTDNGDGTYGYTALYDDDGDGETSSTSDIFKYEAGKFYFMILGEYTYIDDKPETITKTQDIIGENQGDITFSIKAFATTNTAEPVKYNFLHGNVSDGLVITKLSNSSEKIAIDNGIITIADYTGEGSKTPLSYVIKVSPIDEVVGEDGKGTGEYAKELDVNKNEITYTTGNITYTPTSDGGVLHSIDLNNIKVKQTNGEDYLFDQSGDYLVELQFNGNTTDIINSKVVEFMALKLETTSQLKTVNGILNWNPVEGASAYTLYVKEDTEVGTEYKFELDNVTSLEGVELSLDSSDSDESEDESGADTASVVDNVFKFTPGVTYIVKIKANSPKDKISSKWSEEFRVHKLHAPSSVKIVSSTTADSGLEVGTPLLAWENKNTTNQQQKYIIEYIMNGAVATTDEIDYSENTKYNRIATMEAGVCNFQMKIIGNTSDAGHTIGYLTSEYSTEEVFTTFIDDVSGLQFVDNTDDSTSNSGMLNWSAWSDIKNAYSYRVSIYKVETVKTADQEYTESFVKTFYTTNTAVDLSSDGSIEAGKTYRIEVHALTDPTKAITTTKEVDSDITLYRPTVITTLKVKEGMLYWEVSSADIKNYIDFNGLSAGYTASDVINYVVDKINFRPENVNAGLEATFAYLLNANITSNGVTETLIPTKAETLLNEAETDIVGIGYYYSLSKEPQIDTTNTDSGKYTITVANSSNNNNGAAVIQGFNQASPLVVYKPKTPRTWTDNQADVYIGKAQWELSTTVDSTLTKFGYYTEYELVATRNNGEEIARVTIDTKELLKNASTTGATLENNYRFAVNIKKGLFTTAQMLIAENSNLTQEELEARTDLMIANEDYTLFIRAIGTADSAKVSSGPVYLNSSYTKFNEVINILDIPGDYKITNNNLTWQPKYGSTATKVFVYGPFENLSNKNQTSAKLNENWLVTNFVNQINEIESAYLTNGTENDLLNVYTLGLTEGETAGSEKRQTVFTLTGTLTNDGKEYLPGGYVIRLQELGDNKGVIDSSISTNIACHKLGFGIENPLASTDENYDQTRIMQANGWVGLSDQDKTKVYLWNSEFDGWTEKPQEDPNQTSGVFVWNPVAGANQYKIEIMYEAKDVADGQEKEVNTFDTSIYTFYTRETTFTLPDGAIFNNNDYAYSIRITPQRSKTLDSYETLADNVFYAEYHDTTAHERLAAPYEINVDGGGIVSWNIISNYDIGYDNSENAITIYQTFRVLFNEGAESNSTDDTMLEVDGDSGGINLDLYNQSGTIKLQIKTIARSGAIDLVEGQTDLMKVFLNSSYTSAVEVTKLANPDARLVNGVFNWGMGDDPVTTSSLIIDNGEVQTIGEHNETTGSVAPYYEWIKYYTDITEHDADYSAEDDEILYTTGEHTFSVKYDGTKGTLISGSNGTFYVTSEYSDLTAIKLPAPVLDKGNTSIGNVLKWAHIDFAEGYRIMMFGNSSEGTTTTQKIEVSYDRISKGNADGFSLDNGNIVFDLTNAIDLLGVSLTGGDIHIYVQAIGSGMNFDAESGTDVSARDTEENTLYLSSSYSTPVTYGIPSAVQNLTYSSSTGTLSWETSSNADYYIQIAMTYQVSNVTDAELAIWKESADSYFITGVGQATTNGTYKSERYSEVTNRKVTQESKVTSSGVNYYTITVNDTVNLSPKNNNNKTPTSYNVTAVGTYSLFEVIVLTFDPTQGAQTDNNYISAASRLEDMGMAFSKYKSGEGTTYNPYILSQSNHVEAISVNVDRHYKLANNIEMTATWTTIAPTETVEEFTNYLPFTGSIDGDGYAITNYKVSTGTTINGAVAMAFIYKLGEGALIKDLTFEIAEDGMKNNGYYSVVTGVVAVENEGTIENVKVIGDINMQTSGAGDSAQAIAGITYNNYGTISNVSVQGNITSMVDGSYNALASGIAINNYGTIEYASYTSQDTTTVTIKSNKLAGIALNNHGLIDRSYVHETVIINAVDTNKSNDSNSKQVLAGGISGILEQNAEGLSKASITNSYTRASIVLNITNTSSIHSVAGFVASVSKNNTYIANSYAIVNITGTTSSKVSVFNFVNNESLDETNLSLNYYTVDSSEYGQDTIKYVGRVEVIKYSDTDLKTEDNLNTKLLAITDTPYDIDENGKARIRPKTTA